jgi:hypothetical protein
MTISQAMGCMCLEKSLRCHLAAGKIPSDQFIDHLVNQVEDDDHKCDKSTPVTTVNSFSFSGVIGWPDTGSDRACYAGYHTPSRRSSSSGPGDGGQPNAHILRSLPVSSAQPEKAKICRASAFLGHNAKNHQVS